MRRHNAYWIGSAALLVILGLTAEILWPNVVVDFAGALPVNRTPSIRPDYRDATVPPNIAPLNFVVDEPGTAYGVRIRSAHGEAIDVASETSKIIIPMSRWQRLLDTNRGETLYFDVCVRNADGQWTRFDPISNTIAEADIDAYLFYRLMKPIYVIYVDMAICQRDVRTYEESVVLNSRSFENGCVNCHSFTPNHPDQMILQIRNGRNQSHAGMIVVRDGEVRKIDTRTLIRVPESNRGRVKKSMASYVAWHPNGRLAAYSANDLSQFLHTVGDNRDVFDSESDLGLYDADSDTVTTAPNISQPDRLETFPTWSPDGRYLYFCSAAPLPKERYKEIQHDLMHIRYEADSGRWGDVEPVLLAKDTGLSIAEPRVSPDGRWLLFCMSDYGSFPAYRPVSDLYLMDLTTREYRRLAINSERADSWHSWSSNSRWIAFASKRRNGMFSRIYFSYVDERGHVHKPVLLPQEDPTLYDRLIETYNVPELADAPAPAGNRELAKAIRSTGGPTA